MQTLIKTLKQVVSSCALLVVCNVGVAAQKEQRIISHAVAAYGGDALLTLQSISAREQANQYSQWQSSHALQGETVSYVNEQQRMLLIDFTKQHKAFKQVTTRLVGSHGSNMPSVIERLFVADKGYVIDHALKQYQPASNITFENTDFTVSEQLDPLIIRKLYQDKAASKWTDTAYIQGAAHDVLTVHEGSEQQYIVYLNQQTGYLSRMLTERGGQLRSFDFLNHQLQQGFVWAQQLFVSSSEGPIYQAYLRELSFNSLKSQAFSLPKAYKVKPKDVPVDVSKHTFLQLAKGVYFIGQGWGYTLFVDAGEYFISAGAWQMHANDKAWQKNLALLKTHTGLNKPVAQHVVTHHHSDHMMGLEDVIAHGADLIVHPSDISALQAHLTAPLVAQRVIAATNMHTLASNKVVLIDVPNSHASHNLVLYLPEHKLLFSEDMFGSSWQSGFDSPSNWPHGDTYHRLKILTDKLQQQELEVSVYASSHHRRVLTHAEIEQALAIELPTKAQLMQRVLGE
ncbi:hypothetical protein PSECIP111854_02331 [Pseudoalteromonas sp. CIP111854]|uniref:Metallo-beta-lactamase domain-containing protein n=1 Tax=Pseudoalteromonas holothuriae TaxID=2963714 RepID=A0A9W4VW19_9GAMM|nr:MBL fold metallo-hydrolase [Pseudoalteromonas sp. CIP111854]CAH9059090.1 hypothetical protein PSECIP111854_02331 [Pseudoalteromonas sp. CIP111854]